jgi:hypothetical protein
LQFLYTEDQLMGKDKKRRVGGLRSEAKGGD